MKLYFIYDKEHKDIIYKSVSEKEVSNYFKSENLDKKYYCISEVESDIIQEWIKGNLKNDRKRIEQLIRSAI